MKQDTSYLHKREAAVYVPALQAGVVGLVFILSGLLVSYVFRWRAWVTVAGVAGLVGFTATWFALQRYWIMLTLERLTGHDLDGDGRVADLSPLSQNAEPRQSIRLYVSEVRDDGHLSGNTKIMDFPCTEDQLAELARGLVEDGAPFSERHWTGAGRPFSVSGFREIRGEFIRRGLVALASRKDPRQGYVLTVAGRHVLESLLATISPSPTEGQ